MLRVAPGAGPALDYTGRDSPTFRCDRVAYVAGSGCVWTRFRPTLVYGRSAPTVYPRRDGVLTPFGPFPVAADFYARAQGEGRPGAPPSPGLPNDDPAARPLHRETDKMRRDANRRKACGEGATRRR